MRPCRNLVQSSLCALCDSVVKNVFGCSNQYLLATEIYEEPKHHYVHHGSIEMPLCKEDIVKAFEEKFGETPQFVIRAPGRVNLIGEHTDYNDGFVMPLAIDRAIWIALRPRDDGKIVVTSLDYHESGEFDLGDFSHTDAGWIEYLKATAWALQEEGFVLSGWEGVMQGDVPRGAGLSSSAALEMATARSCAAVADLPWDSSKMALLGQKAENKWIGVNCGIMDQMISASGREGEAMLLDCRSLQRDMVPLPSGMAVVILDTSTRRGLVDSKYNERRACCEAAAQSFQVKALRDVTSESLEARKDQLDETTYRRARHVITENERTEEAAKAMKSGDAERLGLLMNESHESLRDDYEVSNDALDAMVEAARSHEGCLGARMTGAGFGGCAVALVRAEEAEDFVAKTSALYKEKTGHDAAVYVCTATEGAAVV